MIVIYKADRRLELHDNGQCINMPIGLGLGPIGNKQCEGDNKTPEGAYYVCTRNEHSKYHLALGLSYPNLIDAQAGLSSGLISHAQFEAISCAMQGKQRPPWDTPLGGYIMLHGGGASDWTAGCIALSDEDMQILWEACPMGTGVLILA